jgi:hypothetical protein
MKTYKVTFTDTIKASTEDDAYGELLDYLSECVRFGDVTAFDFAEESELLSAAPDMFQALQVIVDAFGDQDSLLIDQCKAALAKAKGEA